MIYFISVGLVRLVLFVCVINNNLKIKCLQFNHEALACILVGELFKWNFREKIIHGNSCFQDGWKPVLYPNLPRPLNWHPDCWVSLIVTLHDQQTPSGKRGFYPLAHHFYPGEEGDRTWERLIWRGGQSQSTGDWKPQCLMSSPQYSFSQLMWVITHKGQNEDVSIWPQFLKHNMSLSS